MWMIRILWELIKLKKFANYLKNKFEMKDLGQTKFYLGLQLNTV